MRRGVAPARLTEPRLPHGFNGSATHPFVASRRPVEDHDQKRGDGAEEKGRDPPEQPAPAFALRKSRVDEAERSPPRDKLSVLVHVQHSFR